MALAVIGGGAFAKYVPYARWPEIPVSIEDAAGATAAQICDIVRYVEQSNPHLLDAILSGLAQDGLFGVALGASLGAVMIRRLTQAPGARRA